MLEVTLIYGLINSIILALMALGFSLTFGISGVSNFAYGALYVLAGFARPDEKSEESALKYFLLGAFASAFLIYGIALVYGGTGTTAFPQIVEGAMGGELDLTLTGAGLILAGLAFKVAYFRYWAMY